MKDIPDLSPRKQAERAARERAARRGVARQSAPAQGAGARASRARQRLERRTALQYKQRPRRYDRRLMARSPPRIPGRRGGRAEAMDRIRIRGGVPLDGVIAIGGAKNAALPLMAASLLTDETLTLDNVPDLADITTMANLLVQHGVAIEIAGAGDERPRGSILSAAHITSTTAPYDLVRKMRASVLVLGPAARALRAGAGVAARRLRHRHAAGRSAHQGLARARRPGRAARRLYRGARAQGAARRRNRVSRRSRSARPRIC